MSFEFVSVSFAMGIDTSLHDPYSPCYPGNFLFKSARILLFILGLALFFVLSIKTLKHPLGHVSSLALDMSPCFKGNSQLEEIFIGASWTDLVGSAKVAFRQSEVVLVAFGQVNVPVVIKTSG